MIPPYQKLISPDEYEICVKEGMALMAASIRDAGLDKDAEGPLASMKTLNDFTGRTLLSLSLATGIPVGILMHVAGRKLNRQRAEESRLEDEISYYRHAGKDLEREMVRQGVKTGSAEMRDLLGVFKKAVAAPRDISVVPRAGENAGVIPNAAVVAMRNRPVPKMELPAQTKKSDTGLPRPDPDLPEVPEKGTSQGVVAGGYMPDGTVNTTKS